MSSTGQRRGNDVGVGISALIWLIAVVAAVIIILHIVFVLFSANTGNTFVSFIADAARNLAWFFRDLFTLKDKKLEVVVNYGLAVVVYLAVGRVIARGLSSL